MDDVKDCDKEDGCVTGKKVLRDCCCGEEKKRYT